jgi:hypothetical protein
MDRFEKEASTIPTTFLFFPFPVVNSTGQEGKATERLNFSASGFVPKDIFTPLIRSEVKRFRAMIDSFLKICRIGYLLG